MGADEILHSVCKMLEAIYQEMNVTVSGSSTFEMPCTSSLHIHIGMCDVFNKIYVTSQESLDSSNSRMEMSNLRPSIFSQKTSPHSFLLYDKYFSWCLVLSGGLLFYHHLFLQILVMSLKLENTCRNKTSMKSHYSKYVFFFARLAVQISTNYKRVKYVHWPP